MKFLVALMLVCLVAVSECQRKYPGVKGAVPTDLEIEDLLRDSSAITNLVDCMVAFRFDSQNCDARLRRAHELAYEYFRTSETSCGKCTKYELQQVNKFVRKLSSQYRSEYLRMTQGILERSVNPDYDY